ncbi:membrane protein [Methylophaga marina]|uniref:YqhA family protein n=1 Tax=Methylophaga marina TaxID=45495 RepID=A0ABN0TTI8_9GAMM|nr:YqhA family protein [Methylophaga marina]BDZ74944.1 membrane protein [Methylophaga marina]
MERLFEKALWNSRFVVLVAVIASLITALAMFYMATVDVYYLLSHLGEYMSPDLIGDARKDFRAETVAHVVEVIDGYLLATVLFIFSLGLYELFISKIEEAEESENSKVLAIHSLDDLKARLGRVVLMILIVNFFEHAISMDFHGPLDLLALAGGIGLIALALYFSHADDH